MSWLSRLVVMGAVGVVVAATCGSASAARPIAGASYFGQSARAGNTDDQVLLKVESAGRLSPRSAAEDFCGVAHLRTGRRAGLRVAPNGSFSLTIHRRHTFLSLSGRFVTRNEAIVRWRAHFTGTQTEGCGHINRHAQKVYRGGLPPFKSCRSYPAKNRLLTATGRVFAQGGLLFGCLFDMNKRFLLPTDAADVPDDISNLHLVAPFVAYARFEFEGASCGSVSVKVVDLRSGKLVHDEDAATNIPSCGPPISKLLLKDDGAAGWIVYSGNSPPSAPPEVHAVDASGSRVVDSGYGIDLHSLTLTRSVLSWRNNGVTKTAVLQ